jgi:ADP-ribosylglycohydrolase
MLDAARTSLVGLSVGDAFGTMLDGYGAELARRAAKRLIAMKRPWRWTDDTAMAISIYEQLAAAGTIDPDALAAAFVARFAREPERGYGAGAYGLLARVAAGASWRTEVAGMFGGKGSYGNGAAMRAAPIGAYFASDLERVRAEALRSAMPTHAHPDGAAGAVAIATAAALARLRTPKADILPEVARWTPPSKTRDGLVRAHELGLGFEVQLAGEELGTGANITAHDTVPFAVWCAARHLDSYEDALWTACATPGLDHAPNALALCAIDRDTIGAIVGGIVACAVGMDGIPLLWREATERLAESDS